MVVKEPVAGGQILICHQQEQIASHALAAGQGAMVIDREHYRGLPRRDRMRKATPELPTRELLAGPGVGRHFAVPEVEVRRLAVYEEVSYVSAV